MFDAVIHSQEHQGCLLYSLFWSWSWFWPFVVPLNFIVTLSSARSLWSANSIAVHSVRYLSWITSFLLFLYKWMVTMIFQLDFNNWIVHITFPFYLNVLVDYNCLAVSLRQGQPPFFSLSSLSNTNTPHLHFDFLFRIRSFSVFILISPYCIARLNSQKHGRRCWYLVKFQLNFNPI